jgi:hypothetical protein
MNAVYGQEKSGYLREKDRQHERKIYKDKIASLPH